MNKYLRLFLSIFICFLAAGIGSYFTAPAIKDWYVFLNKPFFSPPNWLFGPVWTILYFLMGISLFLVWGKNKENKKVKTAVFIFGGQLILNSLWSIIFFGLKLPGVAFVEIIILWWAILITILNFLKISKIAGRLLFPYFLWVSFASILNFAIFLLN